MLSEQFVVRKLGLWNIRIGSTAAVVGFGLLAGFWKLLPPELPIWYSRPWGTAQLDNPAWLVVIPTLGLGAAIAAAVGHHLWEQTEPVLAAIIAGSGIVLQILGVLGLLRILLLVL